MNELFRFSPSRLALSYVALSALVLALFAIPLWYAWSVNLTMFKEYVAADDVARMVHVFERDGAAGLAAEIDAQAPGLARDKVVILADPSKSRIAGNLPAWPAEVPDVPGTYGLALGGLPSTMRIVASHIALPGGYHLLVGHESARFQSLVDYFWFGIAGATAIAVVIGALIGWLIRRALLFEVQEMSGAAKAIVAGDLSRRLATRRSTDALAALARTVNDMLEQLARQNVQLADEVATRGQAEQALQRARQDLEGVVEQRTAELQQTKARFEGIVDIADDAIISVGSSQRILLFNQGAEKIFGYGQQEVLGKPLDLLLPQRFANAHRQHLTAFAQSPDVARTMGQRREVFGARKDGREFPAEASISKLDLGGHTVFTVILRDITKRKHAETLLAGEKRLLEVIAKGTPLAETLDALCCLAEEIDPDWRVSVLLLDRDPRRFRHGAAPSLPAGYSAQIDGAPVGAGIGPCALAAHLREQVISADLPTDERWAPDFRALASAHELRACWSTPIVSSDGRVLGTFAIYSNEREAPTQEEHSRIERLTHLASIAIERSTAIDALRRSEERYALAMNAAGDGHIEWIVATDEFYASPRFLEMCGLTRDTTFRDRADFLARFPLHPDDRDRYIDTVNGHFAAETTRLELETRIVRERETRWLHLTGLCTRDAAGALLRWNAAFTDITDRKHAEAALRRSEEGYALAMEASGEGHWDWDIVADTYHASPLMLEMYGFPPGTEFRNRADFLARFPFHPDDRPTWEKAIAAHFAGETARFDIEIRMVPHGETRWIHMTGMLSRDDAGKPVRWTGSVADITERRRAAEELRARQDMLDLAQKVAHAVAFEWRVGAGEGENRWSPDLEALYGLPPGSYDGTYESWKKLVYAEDWPKVREAIKAAQQSGDVDAEYRVAHSGGGIRWLQAKGRMFLEPEGKPTRVVGFMLDVTARHLAEDELRRMERELRQAQRLESMGTLAGGIAHDFNNLLGAILGYGEMALAEAPEGSRLRRDVENMMIAGERGRALVDRILAFSRSGLGERVAVDVEEVATETLALFAAKLPPTIWLHQRLDAGRAAVMGDPTQVHQVLMNLLTNAAQAMPMGGTLQVNLARVHVSETRVAMSGSLTRRDYVVLDITDTGSGIPPEILDKIFDPFFTTKEVGVGSGLGLSLVHGIVTGLGGAIDVATTVGVGSIFKVYLPLAADVTIASKPRKRVPREVQRAGRGRVLIVDDEEALVRLAFETLTPLGYAAVGFTASAAALAAFRAAPERFDAIITDESMPGTSGCELIREMRAIRPTIPILLVSGYLSAAVVERAHDAGASEVLRKPVSAHDLVAALEGMLRAAQAPGASSQSTSAEALPE
jgi:PAS domain S-box-containing protein